MTHKTDDLHAFIKNKKILVTGGTGSIGENLVKAILQYQPKQVIVFNRDDSKQYLMQQKYHKHSNLHYYLGDIRDYQSVEFITHGVDIVFHTAALKQVPICEEHPFEAVKTNIIGSENVIKASILNRVKKVINISTDKAVNPSNTMGATKLISEKLFKQANLMLNNQQTTFCSVRFGNVIGSRGSVVPLLMEQVKLGEPLTITDLNMTRFFMTIPEAVNLTLKAAYYSLGGETYIFKMESLKLKDLTEAIKDYCHKKGKKIPSIKLIGTREGEKLYEELMSPDEQSHVLEDDQLYVILPPYHSLPYLHFRTSSVTIYRSDQVKTISKKKLIALLPQFDER